MNEIIIAKATGTGERDMILGEWNKSVILTYFGMGVAIIGMGLAVCGFTQYAMCCLMVCGVCDLFDGKVARMCKRTPAQEQFGIQIDSLADVVDFLIFPIVLCMGYGMRAWYDFILYVVYVLCGVARLAFFNIDVADGELDKPIKYYSGLPVTYAALIFPVVGLMGIWVDIGILYAVLLAVLAALYILNIKVRKPGGIAYGVFAVLAVALIVLYAAVL